MGGMGKSNNGWKRQNLSWVLGFVCENVIILLYRIWNSGEKKSTVSSAKKVEYIPSYNATRAFRRFTGSEN